MGCGRGLPVRDRPTPHAAALGLVLYRAGAEIDDVPYLLTIHADFVHLERQSHIYTMASALSPQMHICFASFLIPSDCRHNALHAQESRLRCKRRHD